MRSLATIALVIAAGCRGEPRGPRPDSAGAAAPGVALAPADTLVLTVGRSGVWLTEGREARDSTGASCYERSIELRTDSTRVKVPLLYTTHPPRRIDGRSIRAELVRDCRVIAVYRVELSSGRPTKLEDR